MYKNPLPILFVFLLACASQKNARTSNVKAGDTRTKPVELIDDYTYLLLEQSNDPSYGFDKSNPVKVGGFKDGPKNERRFLNALMGPNGEKIGYYRAGSCCPFKTPNGILDNTGLLDRYRLFWTGSKDTLDIYINMYDAGDLQIPVGLMAKSKN